MLILYSTDNNSLKIIGDTDVKHQGAWFSLVLVGYNK